MKTLTLMTAIFLALPLGSALAEEAKKPDPVEVCKAKATFMYNFDMMNIEREQMDRSISHDLADVRKHKRHMQLLGELAECDDLKDD
jgi:hypothetical protein